MTPSNTRIAAFALVSAVIGYAGGLVAAPESSALMIVIAIVVFSVLMLVDGYLSTR